GHGLVSEKCPRLAVACRVRVEKNSIVWYKTKLYDRDRFACVFQHEHGLEARSGCARKPSGAIRCWCYGQSNCNTPENSRKLYRAFVKGDKKELERVIDEIETSDLSDYNYAEPLLNINEPIDMDDSNKVQPLSHTHSPTNHRSRPASQVPVRIDDHSTDHAEPQPTIGSKTSEKGDHKSAHKSSERLHKLSGHTTTTMEPTKAAAAMPTKPSTHVAPTPRLKPSIGLLYEGPGDSEMFPQRKQQNPKFYTEPLDTIRPLPTDQTPRASKTIKPANEYSSEQQKRYGAIELPDEDDQGYLKKEKVRKAASSHMMVPFFGSLLALVVCIFLL
ncbi:hypothetical protein Tcan_15798, partial [Toxocara canis]